MEARQAVAQVLERADLRRRQGAPLLGRQRQLPDALGGIVQEKEIRGGGVHPGGKGGQRGKMIIDRGGGERLRHEGLLPGQHVALETSREARMPRRRRKEGGKPGQMQPDFGGHRRRTHPGHGQVEGLADPGLQMVHLVLTHLS